MTSCAGSKPLDTRWVDRLDDLLPAGPGPVRGTGMSIDAVRTLYRMGHCGGDEVLDLSGQRPLGEHPLRPLLVGFKEVRRGLPHLGEPFEILPPVQRR